MARNSYIHPMITQPVTIAISDAIGSVTAAIMVPANCTFLYVFAHGAGAGMNHPFMVNLSAALARYKIGTMRYNFPFMENGGKRPDPPAIAEKTVNKAISVANDLHPDIPLLAGGKSFGGRMTSQALSKSPNPSVKGIVFVGFPLHPAGNPGTVRAEHLANINIPMLFLQGTRDALANIDLIEKVTADNNTASLRKFEGADHSFKAGKKDLFEPLAESINNWACGHQTPGW